MTMNRIVFLGAALALPFVFLTASVNAQGGNNDHRPSPAQITLPNQHPQQKPAVQAPQQHPQPQPVV
ncbi:MAG: hypothetical protein LBQ54_03730, partial [Planctomycetaceae bacterium]|nr:hypothetical protein [Planctomycetaceae bacterium]